jgi:eukaryotic-like serine/threonine-protein kinase
MNIESGARFDGYEILNRLATGGMGEVWLARDLRLERRVAIKVLPAHLTEDSSRVARFRQEARAASALNHPNVCTIHTLGTTDDRRVFIAMEYIEGRTLRERIDLDSLDVREAIDVAIQVASGLAAAHVAGVIHRDVKPENVMIRSDGLVKVLDFGLAKLDPRIASFEVGRSTRTALHTDGSVAGTVAYMSPEQASGQAVDARTDIFSLGAVLYEMVTGRQPFAGDAPAVVLEGILNRIPPSPLRLNREVSPRLEDIIMKALEKEPDLRYLSASALRTDLVRLQRDTNTSGAGAVRTPDVTAGSRRRGVALAVALLLTFLALGIIGSRSLWSIFFRSGLTEIQLTTNSSENPVSAAAISPDGKYIAYADATGIHVRLIDTGETHAIAAHEIGDINRVLWFPDGSKLIVSGAAAAQGGRPAIWSISIVGGAPRKLREDGFEASVSSDGSQIAFVNPERTHVWIMGPNGEEPRRVISASQGDTFFLPGFLGAHVRYARVHAVADTSGNVKREVFAESRDPEGRTTVLMSHPGLTAGVFLPDGRVLYSLVAEPALNRDASVWEAHTDRHTARVSGGRSIREWPGSVSLWELTSSADGRRVVFLKRSVQKDVYVADLAPDGRPVNPRRFTLDDSTDFATNWTSDGKAVLFSSDRNGTFDIFKQPLDQRVAEAIVSGPDDETGPSAVTPDGAWLYYLVSSKGWRFASASRGSAILRTPASGGPREKVAGESQYHWVLCSRSASAVCVLIEFNNAQMMASALDPVRGKGHTIAVTDVGADPSYPTSLSRDGSRLAILIPSDKRIRVLSLSGEPTRDVRVPGWSLDRAMFHWSADDSGWYVSSTSPRYPVGTNLLHINLNGEVRVVWQQNVRDFTAGIPSPDGRHIALTAASIVSNVWMLKNF